MTLIFSILLVFFRTLMVLITICCYLIPVVLRRLLVGINVPHAMRWTQRWARAILPLLGVHVETKGEAHEEAALYMSNHRSYFDPLACMSTLRMTPISKSEVKKWPFFGFVGRSIGVIFVERDNKKSRKNTLQAISKGIANNYSIMLYPEGTTSDAKEVQELKPGGFRLAAETGIPIVPLAIDYKDPNDAWINSDLFVKHFIQFIGKPRISIKVSYGQALIGNDSEELMLNTRQFINKELLTMREAWDEKA